MKLWACVDSEDHATYKSILRSESPPEMRKDGWNLDEGCIAGDNDDSVAELACRDLSPGTCQEIARLDLIKWEVERVGPVLDGRPKTAPACPVLAERGWDSIIVVRSDGAWEQYTFDESHPFIDRAVDSFPLRHSGPPGSWPSAEGGAQ